MRRLFWAALLLTGCASSTTPNNPGDPTDPGDPNAPVYAGSCPTLVSGENTIQSSGGPRRFLLQVPLTPEGAPVIFTWHWLGGEPDQAINWTGLGAVAGDNNVFVVSPFTHPNSQARWNDGGRASDNEDVALFDDVLACLYEQNTVDLDRIWVTGHSMGGLFISYLVQHRAARIAAFAALSGGLPGDYSKPARPLPALLVWGGPTDECCGGYSFHERTMSFSNALKNDGSFVVHCSGDFGHQLPPMPDMVWPFLRDHVRGEVSPWLNGIPAGALPSWCAIAP